MNNVLFFFVFFSFFGVKVGGSIRHLFKSVPFLVLKVFVNVIF